MVVAKQYKLISACIGIGLALIMGEVLLRVYKYKKYSTDTAIISRNPRLVYEHKPSVDFVNKYGIKISYNSLGFIGDEIGHKDKDTFRILGIGDSIIAGEYLPENERYINKVGTILAKKTKKDVEVVNAGVSGYNTWQELELFKNKGLSVEPDLIIVGLCLNDERGWKPTLKKSWFGRIKEIPQHHKKARYFDFLYQRSQLYQFVYDFLYKIKKRLKKTDNPYEDFEWKPDLRLWEVPLREIVELARSNKIEVLFVVFPLEQQVQRNEKASFAPLAGIFEKEDVHFLDLIKNYNANSDKVLYIKRDIIHPNKLGSKIAAEVTADYVANEGMMDKLNKE